MILNHNIHEQAKDLPGAIKDGAPSVNLARNIAICCHTKTLGLESLVGMEYFMSIMVYRSSSGLKTEVKDQGREGQRRHVLKLCFHGYF